MSTTGKKLLPFILCIIYLHCGSPTILTNSPMVPGAQGEVTLNKDSNNNTTISLSVKHLAPPTKLNPSRSVYIVWVESPEGKVANLGQLQVDDDLEGDFEGTTPFEYFRILITAEDTPTVTQPSLDLVLSTARLKP
ncbi:MAG: hypothetical protein EPO24_15275 [Bacteroidetes bacterium]|nr:MAG: hypothetical protein EPO24_15275 [Bacteroidota bacterium]